MARDKIKIRVSAFILLMLENDCQVFNFINGNDTPNKNAFLNKLIPNLVEFKKYRRQRVQEVLRDEYNHANAEEIYSAVNTIIDEVYFSDAELDYHTETLWIRPHNDCVAVFNEIEDVETAITALDLSSYIRSILNEYARLPQYKRGQLVFKKEFDLFFQAGTESRIINFYYKGEKYKLCFYTHMYGYVMDQINYIIGFDINRKQIRAFNIAYIENPYLIKQKYKISSCLEEKLADFTNNYEYQDDNIVNYEGDI